MAVGNLAEAKIALHHKHMVERHMMHTSQHHEHMAMTHSHHAERHEMHHRHEQELLHEGDYGNPDGKPGSAMSKE